MGVPDANHNTRAPRRSPADGCGRRASLASMPDMLAPGRRILASQPFSVLLGAELPRPRGRARRAQDSDSRRAAAAAWVRPWRRRQLCRGQRAHVRGRQRAGDRRGDVRVQDQLSETRSGRGAGRPGGRRSSRTDPGGLSLRRVRRGTAAPSACARPRKARSRCWGHPPKVRVERAEAPRSRGGSGGWRGERRGQAARLHRRPQQLRDRWRLLVGTLPEHARGDVQRRPAGPIPGG